MIARSLFVAFSVAIVLPQSVSAEDPPQFSLDQLSFHPYRHLPAYGHASQAPGSPKHFVPGYGYRIPGFGFRGGYQATLNSYSQFYRFGQRVPGYYSDAGQRFWRNSYAGPWYHPGWPANTRTAWSAW